MRNRETVLLEFDQLLNLLYSKDPNASPWRWRNAPFLGAVERFFQDAVGVVPSKELRVHATEQWLRKRQLTQNSDVQRSIHELLNATLSAGN